MVMVQLVLPLAVIGVDSGSLNFLGIGYSYPNILAIRSSCESLQSTTWDSCKENLAEMLSTFIFFDRKLLNPLPLLVLYDD